MGGVRPARFTIGQCVPRLYTCSLLLEPPPRLSAAGPIPHVTFLSRSGRFPARGGDTVGGRLRSVSVATWRPPTSVVPACVSLALDWPTGHLSY